MPRLHASVYGLVQGVSFRGFVVQTATALGVKGTVKNCNDGSVEVFAEGSRNNLEMLLSALKKGPRSASVNHVDADWSTETGEFRSFERV